MNRTLQISLFIVLITLAQSAFSQAFQVNFQGQKQQGMGLAGTALYQDASTLFYNPGSVAFAKKNSVNVGFTPVFANILFVDSTTQNGYRTENPMGRPFYAYGHFKAKDSSNLTYGLAVYTPFGSTVQWEEGWAGRFAMMRLSLSSVFIQPTFSYRINDQFGIGGGFVASVGSVNLQRDLPPQFADGSYSRATLAGSAFGMGYNIGLHFNAPNEHFSIGITYRSRIDMRVTKGEATFVVPSSLEANFPSGAFTSSLPLPQVLTLGIAEKFNERFAVAVDVNYVGWSAYDTLAFDYEINTPTLQDTKSPRNYKNIFAFRGGISFSPNEQMTLRAGGGFGYSPVPVGFATPETPDANRFYGTFGMSYALSNKLSLDASLFYTQLKRAETNLETNLSGTFFTKALAPGFSIVYQW